LGRNEPALARYDRTRVSELGIDVVRRPTGGRAVWHEHEVTYAVAAPIAAFGSLRAAYRTIHERLAAALRSLGVDAVLASDRPPVRPSDPGACFAAAAGGEVLIGGRKVVGSAQVRHGRALLQHGSILLDGSQDVVERVATGSGKREAASAATTLTAALGRPVAFDEVANAIIAAWSEESGLSTPSPADPRPHPSAVSRFSSHSWTWRR
jgi:lipoate-protein ligase A